MSTDVIAPLAAVHLPVAPVPSVETGAPGVRGAAFGSLVTQGISHLEEQLQTAQVDLRNLAAGHVGSIHSVLINLEESRMSLQLMLQVRSRLLESYQELLRLQV